MPEFTIRPDDAPPCDQPGCDRLGVIEQVIYAPEWTRTWHWCVFHDPEDFESWGS